MGNTQRELKPWFSLSAAGLELHNVPVPPPPPGADRSVSKPFRLLPLRGSVALRLISNRTAAGNLRLNHWMADLGLAERAEIEDPPRELWPFRQPADPAVGEAWTLTEALFTALRDTRAWQLTAERFRMGRRWQAHYVRDRLAQVVRELGIELVDPTHAFRAAETSRAKAYSRLDGHWNATGHRLAAQSLPPVALEALRTRSAR